MIFSYNWLKDYIKGKLPKPEKLAELLTMHSFEVEEVKKSGSDFILDIDVLPNRAVDCFSHLGVAREIALVTNSKFQIPDYRLPITNYQIKDFLTLELREKRACPRYTAKIVAEVKVGPSPKWMQQRLKVCGLKPINNIVDIANYVMLETGQPLHAFDAEKLEGKKIIVRFARKNEKIVTLDEEKYDLNENILVIADAKKAIAIAGIKGGILPEIDKKTKVVVLESANFNPKVIRKASKELKLKTDASIRFEHGIDPNLTEFALKRACCLIQKFAKGKIAQGLIDIYPKKARPKRIKLELEYLEKLLGVEIPIRKIKNILKKLEFKFIKIRPRYIVVEVPTLRLDISLPEDLIEEIGRIYGFQRIPARFPITALIAPKRNINIFWEDITKNILRTAGFSEVYNHSFVSEKDAKLFNLKPKQLIEVENPISIDQKYLRPSLIPNLLKNIQKNQRYFNEIKIFELGKTFTIMRRKGRTQNNEEKRMLSGIITGDSFYQLKGVIDLLLNKLGMSNIWYDEYEPTPETSEISIWHPKKCAEIKVNHQEIGFLGEIKPKLLEDLKIKRKVVIFDFNFERLQKLSSEETIYQPVSPFPAAVRDLAVLLPKEVRVVDVLNRINRVGGETVRDVDLFDIYEGPEIPSQKKNLAFHIIYQSEKKTLRAQEIDKIQNKIIKALEKESGWEVRRWKQAS